ncbi:hypothetical protein ASG22_05615 [Chryseobacterium sp. Leaf405]|uniref:hypothetical protein n=1 Tax=Chryseobacterium sp. Leaf405 TaxID=1736367 RepID=UPI0006F85F2C|nr:hypothetical protein [Chryseobacterium sp. Leaf405]KQT26147.1 hypothetical protein ASG22_05615 [Chryseobacterium sp. Leaf405]
MNFLKLKIFNFFWKSFVWLDYVVRYKKQPKSIELTNNKNFVKVDGTLIAFYLKEFYHYEILEDTNLL